MGFCSVRCLFPTPSYILRNVFVLCWARLYQCRRMAFQESSDRFLYIILYSLGFGCFAKCSGKLKMFHLWFRLSHCLAAASFKLINILYKHFLSTSVDTSLCAYITPRLKETQKYVMISAVKGGRRECFRNSLRGDVCMQNWGLIGRSGSKLLLV